MGASAVKAGEAFVEISAKKGKLDLVLAAAQAKLKAFGAGVKRIGSALPGALNGASKGLSSFAGGTAKVGGLLSGIGGAGIVGIGAMVSSFSDAGSALDDMSQRTGVAVEDLSRMGYAAKMSGASIEDVEKSVRTMGKNLDAAGKGNKAAIASLDALALTSKELEGLTPDKQFAVLAERLSQIEDPGARAAAAMKVFGKSGANLLPMLNGGAAGLQDMYAEAERLGVVMSGEDAQAAASFGDAMDTLWTVIDSVKNTIGAALAPVLTDLMDNLTYGITVVREFLDTNREWIVIAAQVAAAVGVAGVVLVGIAGTTAVVAAALSGLITIAGAVGTAFSVMGVIIGAVMSPIGLVVAGIAGVGAAILYYSGAGGAALGWLSDQFTSLMEFAMPVFEGIQSALMSGNFGAAADVLWKTLEIAWRTGTQSLYGIWLDGTNLMRDIWTDVTGYITDNFGGVINWLVGAWESAVNQIAKSLLYLYSLFDRSVDYEAAAKQMDKDVQKKKAEREKNGFASPAEREKEKKQRDADDQSKKDEFANRIGDLKDQLATSLKGIKDEAAKPKERKELKLPDLTKLANTLPTPAEIKKEAKTTTVGTFSGFAAGMIGNGTSTFERILDEQTRTADAAERTADNTEDMENGTKLDN